MNNGILATKDIFTVNNSVILHVCNVDGGFGSGFAGRMAQLYPHVKERYRYLHATGSLELGKIWVSELGELQAMVGLLAMPTYRKPEEAPGKLYLNYDYLEKAVKEAAVALPRHKFLEGRLPVVPYGMGAGNAGGEWHKVVEILDNYLPYYVVCKLP